MAGKEKSLYSNVMWFTNRVTVDREFFDCLEAQREVNNKPCYDSGEFYSEKIQRNIQYESGLEKKFIEILEADELVACYREQPVTIKYKKGKRKKNYTPDFAILLITGEVVICEVKELAQMLDDEVQLKVQAMMDYCSKKGFGFLLTNGVDTFETLTRKLSKVQINRPFETEILSYIEEQPLRIRDYKKIAKQHNATQNDLLKVVLEHDLRLSSYPRFKLREGKLNPVFRQVFVEKKRFDDLVVKRYSTLFK